LGFSHLLGSSSQDDKVVGFGLTTGFSGDWELGVGFWSVIISISFLWLIYVYYNLLMYTTIHCLYNLCIIIILANLIS
jgi:hypothetical protein